MHAPVAKKEGLPGDVIERIRSRGDLAALPARYVRAARVVQHVLARESVPSPLQDEVQQEVGVSGLIELVVLAGYYQTIAAVLFAFELARRRRADRKSTRLNSSHFVPSRMPSSA